MIDLVSRVLSAITQREQAARAATHQRWVTRYFDDGHAMSAVAVTVEGADGNPEPDQIVALTLYQAPRVVDVADQRWDENAAHIALNDPHAVLRLCQSLRDIVERYQKAWGRRNTGTADEQALRQMYAIAMIDVLSDLAHGLGVEVDTPAETVIQFTGTPSNFDEVCRFLGTQQHGHREEGYGPDAHMLLYTDDGQVRVGVSDWVARRDDGSFEVLSEEAVAGGLGIEDTP